MKKKKRPTQKKDGAQKTRTQLALENERLRKRIKELREGDSLRFEGEAWFGVTDFFDPSKIQRIPAPPIEGATHMMGFVEDVLVIQVPCSESPENLQGFATYLQQVGIQVPYLIVTSDVGFMRLRKASDEETARLDKSAAEERAEIVLQSEDGDEHPRGQSPAREITNQCPECGELGDPEQGCVYCGRGRRVPAGPGSELHGDGVGGRGPEDAEGCGDGSDPNGEGEGDRAAERG